MYLMMCPAIWRIQGWMDDIGNIYKLGTFIESKSYIYIS